MATIEERVEHAVTVGTRWADNLDANAYDAKHRLKDDELARRLRARQRDIQDLIGILTGAEDLYIDQLNRHRKEQQA